MTTAFQQAVNAARNVLDIGDSTIEQVVQATITAYLQHSIAGLNSTGAHYLDSFAPMAVNGTIAGKISTESFANSQANNTITITAPAEKVIVTEIELSPSDMFVLESLKTLPTTLTFEQIQITTWLLNFLRDKFEMAGDLNLTELVDDYCDMLDVVEITIAFEDEFDVYVPDLMSDNVLQKMRWIDLVNLFDSCCTAD